MQKAKLVFMTEPSPIWESGALFRERGTDRIFRGVLSNSGVHMNRTFERIYPIYISEDDPIEPGDKIYGGLGDKPKVCNVNLKEGESLKPGHFNSYKVVPIHMTARRSYQEEIIRGKLKEGDTVLVSEI